jgi:alpha-beta hydrolase superfamily lysophospholipase
MTSATGTFSTQDGTELFTRHWECTDPRASMLIIHGIGEHCGRWEHVGAYFSGAGFDVHSYDQRGHGRSSDGPVDIESFDLYLDDVQERLTGLAPPVVIYGHSMGGLIGAAYAESDRPQPDLYVLSAPALSASVPAVLRLAATVLSKVTPSLAMKNSIKGEQLSRDPAVAEAYFADPYVYERTTTRFGDAFLATMDRTREAVDQIRTPMLVIHGANDELVPPAASAPLAAVPSVERKLFPGLRHEIHNEPEQEEVFGFVVAWLDDQLAAVGG